MSGSESEIGSKSVAVIIATRGRSAIVARLAKSMADQTNPPDAIYVIGSCEEDLAELDRNQPGLTAKVGRTGLTKQRNDGLAFARGRFSYVVFFDDDFIPSRYWLETMKGLYRKNSDLISVTGTVLADGIATAGISIEEGQRIVSQQDTKISTGGRLHDGFGPYGCNMSFRASAIDDMRFDERLPLYGWLEDCDFGGQIQHRGREARADALWGVHLGHKIGRGRGITLGYSQLINAFYIARKGKLSIAFLAKIAVRNFIVNLLRSLNPEPFIDRRGRLYGNFIAIADILRGRITPERAAEL